MFWAKTNKYSKIILKVNIQKSQIPSSLKPQEADEIIETAVAEHCRNEDFCCCCMVFM